MKWALVSCLALALAAATFAGENTGKIITAKYSGPGDGKPFEAIINDDAGNPLADIKCSEVERGKKDIKVYWLDPEHMPDAEANFYFTWGTVVQELNVEKNCVGIVQLRNFYPEGKATITARVVFVGHVANRVKLGNIKPAYFIPVANTPGQWGSAVNAKGLEGKLEEGVDTPKYLDLTEYGAKVVVDAQNYEATFTWTYDPSTGFAVTDGQLDIGLIQFQK
jgi:hypothetical protein